MLVFLTPELLILLLGLVGLADAPLTHLFLARFYALLAAAASPLGLAAFIIPPPLVAHKKNRRFWVWLVAAVLLGPYALIVAFLRKVEDDHVDPEAESLPACPGCQHKYRPADYRPGAPTWSCGYCGAELPRPPENAA